MSSAARRLGADFIEASEALATAGERAIDLMIASLDRTRAVQRILDELQFDLRECGDRIMALGKAWAGIVVVAPKAGPARLRDVAALLEESAQAAELTDSDFGDWPDREVLLQERDELLARMSETGLTAFAMRTAAAAFRLAASKLESH